jgi:hypothetical protein
MDTARRSMDLHGAPAFFAETQKITFAVLV